MPSFPNLRYFDSHIQSWTKVQYTEFQFFDI
jgi:hypothetical protein